MPSRTYLMLEERLKARLEARTALLQSFFLGAARFLIAAFSGATTLVVESFSGQAPTASGDSRL
jgi:hypothetical protein